MDLYHSGEQYVGYRRSGFCVILMALEAPTNENTVVQLTDGRIFTKLKGVTTHTATSKETSVNYIIDNIRRKLPRVQQLPQFMQVKGPNVPIILIGGGPSLKRPEVVAELKELAAKYETFACGSSHDWCVVNGISPTYCAVVDSDPVTLNYLTKPQDKTVYMFASQCHPDLFKRFENNRVVLWHCAGQGSVQEIENLEPGAVWIGGGCTVGLRAINLSIILGYSNIHLFGFDSCLGEDSEDHAYPLTEDREIHGLTGESGQIYLVRMGVDAPTSKEYRCMGYQLAQLHNFQELYERYGCYFTPTVHGGGAIAAAVEIINSRAEIHRKLSFQTLTI